MSVYSKKAFSLLKDKLVGWFRLPKDLINYGIGAIELKRDTNDKEFPIISYIPIVGNGRMSAGNLDRHYFLQDIYMAKKVKSINPDMHYDIGSRLDGFISHLLSYEIPITMIDIRPLPQKIDGLLFIQSDATSLANIESNSIHSLSSLHAVEHFGLSRYGDKIDSKASDKAMKEMQRVIAPDGFLFFSVPISNRNGIVYNSHRVFKPAYILNQFDKMRLISFAFIRDYEIKEYKNFEAHQIIENNEFEEYDCGLFVMKKDIE